MNASDSDYSSIPLCLANVEPKKSLITVRDMSSGRLSFDILPDLKQIAQESLKRNEVVLHYGWVVYSDNKDYGRVLFHSIQSSLGPKIRIKMLSNALDEKSNSLEKLN
jgi:hypothetical protein